jgi:hypothetical protein
MRRQEEMGMQFRAVVLATAMLAFSSAPAWSVRIIGYGLESCGEWTYVRRTENATNLLYASWALGYLSGVNAANENFTKKDLLERQDARGLLAWMDNYCRANPLDKIGKALGMLVNELLKR